MNLNATILGQAIAFIFFVLFCMKYVWPPLMVVIEKRQKEIADGLAFTERAKKNLDVAQSQANNYLKKAKVEAQTIVKQANDRKAQIINEAKHQAEIERNKILAQAKIDIEVERKRIREELRKQVSMLVLVGAEKILERSVDEAANRAIIDKVVATL